MDTSDAEAAWEQARNLFQNGEYEQALVVLDTLDRAFPDSAVVLYERGECLIRANRAYEARLVAARLHQLALDKGNSPEGVHYRERHDKLAAQLAAIPHYAQTLEAGPTDKVDRPAVSPLAIVWGVLVCAILGVVLLFVQGERSQRFGTATTATSPPSLEVTGEDPFASDTADGAEEEENSAQDAEESEDDGSVPATKADMIAELRGGSLGINGYAALEERIRMEDLDLLHDILRNSSKNSSRRMAARLCAHLAKRQSIDPLILVLNMDTYWRARRNAVYGLSRIAASSTIRDALIHALHTDDRAEVRTTAAGALLNLYGEAMLPEIQLQATRERQSGPRFTMRWLLDTTYKGTVPPTLQPGMSSYASYNGTLYGVYVPQRYSPAVKSKVLITVPGYHGVPMKFLDFCRPDADARNLVVIVPYFDQVNFYDYDDLNLGINRMRGHDRVRADQRLLEIANHLSGHLNIDTDRFYLYGQSKGGAFVTRFVMAHPDRVLRAAAADPQVYLLPRANRVFPYGIIDNAYASDLGELDYGNFVESHLAIIVGLKGERRHITGAESFLQTAEAFARENGRKSNVRIMTTNDRAFTTRVNLDVCRGFLFLAETGRL